MLQRDKLITVEAAADSMKGKHSLVSIVTVSLNQGRFLRRCIESVRDQPGPKEHILIDAESTDETPNVIGKYRGELSEIIVEGDAGPADGLNKGFSRAKGSILCYLNADDCFAPDSFEIVRDFFYAHPKIDVVCGAIQYIDENGNKRPRKRTSDQFDLTRYAAGLCTIGQQATFFRRRAYDRVGGFNVDNRVAWDGELLVDLALTGARFATLNKVLGYFRIHKNSLSTGQAQQQAYLEALKTHYACMQQKARAAGVKIYAPRERVLRTLMYKLDPIRHISYFIVR